MNTHRHRHRQLYGGLQREGAGGREKKEDLTLNGEHAIQYTDGIL